MASLSLIPVGKAGVGKSTTGNFFLTGTPHGRFKTSGGVDSCTLFPKKERAKNIAYTDMPGLPDTNPLRTKHCYNHCIDQLKKEQTAILFVFKKEKIDVEAYQRAAILFREINKAECLKIMLINDHNKNIFGSPIASTEEEFVKLAASIVNLTKIQFDAFAFMDSESAQDVINIIKNALLESKLEAVKSPGLRNFDEVSRWVDSLRENRNFREAAVSEEQRELKRLRRRLTAAEFAAAGAAVATIAATAVALYTAGASLGIASSAVGAATSIVAAVEKLKLDIRKREGELDSDSFIDSAAKELESATEQFMELKIALGDIS